MGQQEVNSGYFTLNTGAKIPAVGLGTWQADGASCKAAVATALEVGYRHVDCAHLYGNEVEVGQALREAFTGPGCKLRREEVFITSKLWCTTNAPKRVESAVEVSLKNLGLAYLDLYLLHWPVLPALGDATDPPSRKAGGELMIKPSWRVESTWRAMEALVAKGVVKAIGLSNFSISQVEEILSFAKIVPAVNQVELHPYWRQEELIKYCLSKGIHVSAHTPLGVPGSNLERTAAGYMSGEDEPESSSSNATSFSRSCSVHGPMLRTSLVAEIAERLKRTPAQVILRWGVQRGTSVLPRSLRRDRIASNFDILNWCLSQQDWNKINRMEPQIPMIDSSFSYRMEDGPLQAVPETDDTDPAEDLES